FGELVPSANKKMLEPAPEFRHLLNPSAIELVLVPGIAFDRQGHRLGFGGGYFDRFLPKAPKAFRIGLAFEVQLSDDALPKEAHDAQLDCIVTEKSIIKTGRSN